MKSNIQKSINICSDPILKDRLAQQGIDAHVFDAILTQEEKIKMLESLEKFASNWFLTHAGVDYTEYRDVSIGAAVHDEVMTLFHLLIHFIFIIDKLGVEREIVFYHSKSCIMPDTVIEFLCDSNIRVEIMDEKYPWLSYKEQLDSQAIANFSRISFGHDKRRYREIRAKLGQIKSALKQALSRILCGILKKSKRNIYFHANRSLINFYNSLLNNGNNNFGMYITDTTPLESKIDKRKLNIFKEIRQLFRLAQRGVMLDSLKCPFYYKWYLNYKKGTFLKKLTNDFEREFSAKTVSCLRVKNKTLLKYLLQTLSKFYLNHLIQFMKLIDFYQQKFRQIKVDLCLQEMCHPFQAQVLANIGIPCRIYPSNYILHNQYFAPFFFKKIKHFVKPLAFSDLDAKRFNRLGFDEENIQPLDPSFFRHWDNEILPFNKVNSLKGKNILILAPSIIALDTFRYQMQSERLFSFFSDVFEVLSELKVSSVTIRAHPGANVPRNQFSYTDGDIIKYLVNKINDSGKHFKVIFSESYYHNLENDILNNDIVIANLSGAVFETLLFGRDYIYFDDTVTPYYGTKDWSIFNEGTIKRLETKRELRKYLTEYNMPNIELLRQKLLGDILTQGSDNRTLDPFTLL